ncbi:hypothetical protein P7K49_000303 [Saguinus oedipus]|uniref:40S ribosomal protein S15 n=1 Tax=Saguinus oedipus TaxID=9490 RepID=A0ABQ9WBD6_SAGOE|nr:hypothetical protein P7K49_000303 [Saguinus oedipus]
MAEVEQKKKRTFCKFTYRSVHLDGRGGAESGPLAETALAAEAPAQGQEGSTAYGESRSGEDAPAGHNMIILPEMMGSMVGGLQQQTFNQVEVKLEMIGLYLGELSIT